MEKKKEVIKKKQKDTEQKLVCSIVIPVYNAERFIEETVRSVMNQTIKDIEIICVNDCSKDNSVDIIKKLQKEDKRIILLENETNLKVSQTRNKGINFAKSDWIALLDADDKWEPNFLEKVIARRDETGGRLVSTSCKYMSNEGKLLEGEFIIDKEITYKKLLKQNKILCSSVFVEKALLQKYPFYADAVHEDYVCWLNVLKEIGTSYGVQEPLMIYRLTVGSKSRNKFKALKMSYNTYKIHGLNFLKRSYYTICNAINGLKKYSKIKK